MNKVLQIIVSVVGSMTLRTCFKVLSKYLTIMIEFFPLWQKMHSIADLKRIIRYFYDHNKNLYN